MEMGDDEVSVVKLEIERNAGDDDARKSADDKSDDEADDVEHRHLEARPAIPHGREPAEDLKRRRDGHCHARRRVETVADARKARREHMVDPKAEGEDSCRDQRKDHDRIGEHWTTTERLDDDADEAGRRQEDDVDLGMSKEPEKVLPEKGIAMFELVIELRTDQAVGNEHAGSQCD